MMQLFGTDGIRGIANHYPITPEIGVRLGKAVIRHCKEKGAKPGVVIGRDTRISGEMLEHAVLSGVLAEGGNAFRLGVFPTPGVAYLTKKLGAGAGIMISASHNSYEYNGFKLFSRQGFKPSEDEELQFEDLILSKDDKIYEENPGRIETIDNACEQYISFLEKTLPEKRSLQGMKVVLDCANGATWQAAPAVFERLGAKADLLFIEPDGKNINLNCGSQYTANLSRKVIETGADAGLAFDGDGDRLIAVDEKGKALTGDQILFICAKNMSARKNLKNNIVVSTVMSNIGFRLALKQLGIEQVSTGVGDRQVTEKMKELNADLGGEASGHIIFLRHHTTGDGIFSALQLLSAIKISERPLSELSAMMDTFPQVLINVPIKTKPDIATVPELAHAVKKIENKLGERGRVLIRYSGTEPVCRVMVEGEEKERVDTYARHIAEVVKKVMVD